MKARFTFMGSGTSRGVPMMGCHCETCASADPCDRHLRSSGYIEAEDGTAILIDCGPDLREESLREGISRLDAVLLTHTHADHLDGLDDLQGFTQCMRCSLPFYASPEMLRVVHQRFGYVDKLRRRPDGSIRWTVPQLDFREVTAPFAIGGHAVTPLPIWHGGQLITGYRIGSMAYVCDCSGIPEGTYPLLEGLSDLVIDALRWRPHDTHFCISQAEEQIARIRPARAWLTHLTHDVLYSRDQPKMKPGNTLAYDGLSFDFTLDP